MQKIMYFFLSTVKMESQKNRELYISFDVETLGGSTDINWMVNIGMVAATSDGAIHGELSVNFSQPEGTISNPDTLKWFQSLPNNVWSEITRDPISPKDGMIKIRDWIAQFIAHGYKIIYVAYPTIYDGTWLYHYWFKYLGHPNGGKGPGFSMIDIRSYAAGKLGISYFDACKGQALQQYKPPKDQFPHTHTGLDDAREQLQLFLNILNK